MEVEEVPFSELLSEIINNRGKTCPTADTGIPLIATNCIRNELLYPTYEKARFVSQEIYDTWFRGHPQAGDIIFVNKATPGRVCLVPDPVDFCIAQDMVAVRANEKKVYPKFLFALLRSPAVQAKIGQMHVGTLIPHFKKGDFDKLLLPIPDRKTQEFIGDNYFMLSAKIELNRRMNETLEAMARALFQNWFVDATQAGLPKGWCEVPLPEAIEVNPSRPLRKGEVAPYLDMANMPTHAARAMEVYDREFGSGMRFMDGDTLVARITPCLENGKTCFVDFLGDGKVGWGSTEYIVLRPKPPLPPEFAYFLARTENFRAFAISNMTGTSGRQRVPADCLNNFTVVVPPAEIAERFGQFARAVFAQIKAHDEQSRTLAALRDALLPKLLSGELRLPSPGLPPSRGFGETSRQAGVPSDGKSVNHTA